MPCSPRPRRVTTVSSTIYVRRLGNREIVGTVEVSSRTSSKAIDRVVGGMLINLHEDYFVDATEAYDAARELEVDGGH